MNLREAAKNEYRTAAADPTHEEIQTGCLQRIAYATEKVAAGYITLQNDRDWYKKMYNNQLDESARLVRVIRSLRGVITRGKR